MASCLSATAAVHISPNDLATDGLSLSRSHTHTRARGSALSTWVHIAHTRTLVTPLLSFKKSMCCMPPWQRSSWLAGLAQPWPTVSCDKHRSSMWRLQSCLLPLHLLHQAWRMLQTRVMMTASCVCFCWTLTEETRLYFSTAEPFGWITCHVNELPLLSRVLKRLSWLSQICEPKNAASHVYLLLNT